MNARARGFTLFELLLAMALGAGVIAGLLTLTHALGESIRQQQALAGLQSSARLALESLAAEIEGAGATDQPWLPGQRPAVSGSLAATSGDADVLVLTRRNTRNCLGNDNPARDAAGQPLPWQMRSEFALRDGERLVRTCFYGPGPGAGTRQLNAATLVEGIEAFSVRFGEDRDDDGRVDEWIRAGSWTSEPGVLGVRLGVLIVGPHAIGVPSPGRIELLGDLIDVPDDGRPRLVLERTVPIRSRLF